MSITNKAELRAAVKDYLEKPNTLPDARIDDAIVFTETQINNLLRTAAMETRATANTVGGEDYIVVPGTPASNFGGIRNLKITGDAGQGLEPQAPQYMDNHYAGWAQQKPLAYCVVDGQIRLAPVPDGTYELEVSYYKRVPALVNDTDTNWVLDDYPRIYLSGSCRHSWRYLRGTEAIAESAAWAAEFQEAIAELQAADKADRWHAPRRMLHDYPVR